MSSETNNLVSFFQKLLQNILPEIDIANKIIEIEIYFHFSNKV